MYCLGTGTSCTSLGASILQSTNGFAGPFAPITAPEIAMSNFKFYVVGATRGDAIQPRVSITLSGAVKVSETQQTKLNIQTTITQRLYDL